MRNYLTSFLVNLDFRLQSFVNLQFAGHPVVIGIREPNALISKVIVDFRTSGFLFPEFRVFTFNAWIGHSSSDFLAGLALYLQYFTSNFPSL